MIEAAFLKLLNIKYPLMHLVEIGLNFLLIFLQLYLFRFVVRKNHLNSFFQTIVRSRYFKVLCVGYILLFIHIIPLGVMGPLVQTDDYVSGYDTYKNKETPGFLPGKSTVDYDHNTQTFLRKEGTASLESFVLYTQAGHNIFRHPVSGFVWFGTWNLTKSYVGFKYVLLVLFTLNAILFGELLKKITKSEYLSFLGAVFFLISPLNYTDGSHLWTLSMAKSQTGFLFIFLSILCFARFLKRAEIKFLVFTLIAYVLSIMSWEVFMGFVLCYPAMYFFAPHLNIPEGGEIDAKKIKRNLLIISPLFILAPVSVKQIILQLTLSSPYSDIAPVYSFVDPAIWMKNWLKGMLGISIDGNMENIPRFSYLKDAAANLIYFPREFMEFIRLHISNPLHYIKYANISGWVILFYFVGFSVLNLFLLFPGGDSPERLKRSHLNFSVLFGLTLFASSIFTPLFTLGHIYMRYVYIGYSGLILVLLAVISKIQHRSTDNNYSNVLVLTCLTLSEVSVLKHVF